MLSNRLKLGFLLPDLGPSQAASSLFRHASAWLREHPEGDIVTFFDDLAGLGRPAEVGILHSNEAYGFDGVLVATTLKTAANLRKCLSPKVKAFYLWDLEWTRGVVDYASCAAIYQSPDLHIVVRGREHARMFETAWNRTPDGVVSDFNITDFVKLLCQN